MFHYQENSNLIANTLKPVVINGLNILLWKLTKQSYDLKSYLTTCPWILTKEKVYLLTYYLQNLLFTSFVQVIKIFFVHFFYTVHEQTVVHWLDGTGVTRCPDCTKSFNITRRQHHCRLCGSIVCNECSCFLPLSKACWY